MSDPSEDMLESAPPASPLSYERRATVGSLVLDRRSDGSVTITVLRSWRDVLRELAICLLGGALIQTAVLMALVGCIWVYGWHNKSWANAGLSLPVLLCVTAPGALFPVLARAQTIVSFFWPETVSAGPFGVSYRRRTAKGIDVKQWPAGAVGDVRHERRRPIALPVGAWSAVVYQTNGLTAELGTGSETEAKYIAAELRGALLLPPDPLGIAAYPPDRRGWQRAFVPRGVALRQLPSIGRLTAAVAYGLFFVATGSALAAAKYFAPPAAGRWPWQWEFGTLFEAAFAAAFELIWFAAAVRGAARRAELTISGSAAVIGEHAPWRPWLRELPLTNPLVRVDPWPARWRGRRRAMLRLTIAGEHFELLRGRPRPEVEWVAENLSAAIARAGTTRS